MANTKEKESRAIDIDMIKSMARIETMQVMMSEDFREHKADDSDQFDRLYKADKQILEKMELIPENIKKEILIVADERYTHDKEFAVFKTRVMTFAIIVIFTASLLADLASGYIKRTLLQNNIEAKK